MKKNYSAPQIRVRNVALSINCLSGNGAKARNFTAAPTDEPADDIWGNTQDQ